MADNASHYEPPEFWRAKDAARALGIGHTTYWEYARREGFPVPMRPSARCTLWRREEVLDFFAGYAGVPSAGRGRPRKARA
jgi:predicted DNA-binding transcriptional regulator AlpA